MFAGDMTAKLAPGESPSTFHRPFPGFNSREGLGTCTVPSKPAVTQSCSDDKNCCSSGVCGLPNS